MTGAVLRPFAKDDPEAEGLREVATYLIHRGLAAHDPKPADMFTQLLELPMRFPEERVSVRRAARYFYMSRRALGRWCERTGLPTPSHILAFGRVLRTVQLVRKCGLTIRRAAAATGWPDAFTLSNTMVRLTGLRPSQAKRHGLVYVAEAWLQREIDGGRAALGTPSPPTCPSCGQEVTVARPEAEGGRHERRAS